MCGEVRYVFSMKFNLTSLDQVVQIDFIIVYARCRAVPEGAAYMSKIDRPKAGGENTLSLARESLAGPLSQFRSHPSWKHGRSPRTSE